jgi:hypothetical protein
MSDLVVIVFPTGAKAEEVRQTLLAMQKEYLLELGDAVIAADLTRSHQASRAASRSGRRASGLACFARLSSARTAFCPPARRAVDRNGTRAFGRAGLNATSVFPTVCGGRDTAA